MRHEKTIKKSLNLFHSIYINYFCLLIIALHLWLFCNQVTYFQFTSRWARFQLELIEFSEFLPVAISRIRRIQMKLAEKAARRFAIAHPAFSRARFSTARETYSCPTHQKAARTRREPLFLRRLSSSTLVCASELPARSGRKNQPSALFVCVMNKKPSARASEWARYTFKARFKLASASKYVPRERARSQ